MMNNDLFAINNQVLTNNNTIFLNAINKLEKIINDFCDNKEKDVILKQIINVIAILNNMIKENKNYMSKLGKKIDNLNNKLIIITIIIIISLMA